VAWMRQAITAGVIGQVTSVDMLLAWDHNWVSGTAFDRIPQLVLYDFAIHWFDMLHCYTPGQTCRRAFAALTRAPGQKARPPLLAQVTLDFDQAQAALQFRASTGAGPVDRTVIVGTQGTLVSQGPNLNAQTVTLYTSAGQASPTLEGTWFPDGFDGTMSELLCAIEDNREPYNSGADNLESLAMAFAAIASTERGMPVEPGTVRRLEDRWLADA
jgi:predicted dehydrogenase